MFKITFKGKISGEVPMEQEQSLLVAASREKLGLEHRCGGHGRCGSCRVTVEEGEAHLSPAGESERRVLDILKSQPEQRLACQCWAKGDVVCRVD